MTLEPVIDEPENQEEKNRVKHPESEFFPISGTFDLTEPAFQLRIRFGNFPLQLSDGFQKPGTDGSAFQVTDIVFVFKLFSVFQFGFSECIDQHIIGMVYFFLVNGVNKAAVQFYAVNALFGEQQKENLEHTLAMFLILVEEKTDKLFVIVTIKVRKDQHCEGGMDGAAGFYNFIVDLLPVIVSDHT
ncbi:MAG: hypothetical protein PHW04_11000 [Candidatus Wallbacteria bacterium]|nr:hypothetical protein [Candidatus Wallbacteria bacterium]